MVKNSEDSLARKMQKEVLFAKKLTKLAQKPTVIANLSEVERKDLSDRRGVLRFFVIDIKEAHKLGKPANLSKSSMDAIKRAQDVVKKYTTKTRNITPSR